MIFINNELSTVTNIRHLLKSENNKIILDKNKYVLLLFVSVFDHRL